MNFKAIVTLLLLSIYSAFGQNAEVKDLLLDKTLKKDSIKAEFAELYNLTNIIHPGQFMFCSKKEFDKTYLKLEKSIKTDFSIVEYYKLTATLMAKIKDGHTAVDRTQISSLLKDRLVFPFSIYKIKGNYFLDKCTIENKDYVGLQVIKINGKEMNSIVKEIQKYIHLEGQNKTGLNTRFKNFPFYYFIFNQADKFEIEYLDHKNHKQKRIFNGVTFETHTNNITEKNEPLTTEFKTTNLAILKFHSFANGYNEPDRKIAEKKLDQFFAQLDSLKTKNLIIDLRNNSGGAPEMANYLFSYITNKPYHFFDYIGAKYNSVKEWKHYAQYPDNIGDINLAETRLKNGLNCYTETDSTDYWWFEQQQNKPNYYKGNIRVLINGGCFSTTGHFLSLLREHKIGTFYGEYSQGSNYSNSGGQAFVLPYTKTLVWIPTFQFKMRTPNFRSDPKGIKPDLELQIEPNDLKTKFDRQMDYLIKEIEQNK
jgi:C-terminal processing protease CtpA/Prc